MRITILGSLLLTFFVQALASCQDRLVTGQNADNAAKDTDLQTQEKLEFLRIRRNDNGQPEALETAIATFVSGPQSQYPNVEVALVGAVHIGGREYYDELNRRFRDYDSVLFELVAEEGTRITPEQATGGRSPVSALQVGMKDLLELEFQLEKIDYQATNFRHADMSPQEFAQDMADRGDSMVQTLFRMMGAGLAMQASGNGGDAGLLLALMAPDRTRQLRRAMAKQFQEMEATTIGMAGADGKSTLITERNAKAFQVLEKELKAGKNKVAVFYGAGHLPDMAERLERDFGFKLSSKSVEFLEAWDLR